MPPCLSINALKPSKYFLVFLISAWFSASAQNTLYKEKYRPQYHFTPPQHWMNDPNGLVYFEGEYHLFYQYDPDKGGKSWGHAVSKDLVHWTHLPVAIPEEDDDNMIYSGSAVVDYTNSSGLCAGDKPCMVAIYTAHTEKKPRWQPGNEWLEAQHIAYSHDNGRSWTKYKGNPVLDLNKKNFRDPKVFWHKPSGKWVMAVVLPDERKVSFYGSKNLKKWTHLSNFGPAGSVQGIWECPDLVELPVVGGAEKSKWVLFVSVTSGAPAGGSGMQYFTGNFNGTHFTSDTPAQTANWVDYGKDFYAAVSWNNLPGNKSRPVWIGWMNNWLYATSLPTAPWKGGAQSVPREIYLKKDAAGLKLVQQPIDKLRLLRGKHYPLKNRFITSSSTLQPIGAVKGHVLEVIAEFELQDATEFGLQIGKGQENIIGYNVEEKILFVERAAAGINPIPKDFLGRFTTPLVPNRKKVKLHIFLDESSIEVLGDEGKVAITAQIFPDPGSNAFTLYAKKGSVKLLRMDVWELNSIYP